MWIISQENPEGRAFIVVIIVFLVLAALTCSLRVWARRITKVSLDASDYTCYLGLVGIRFQLESQRGAMASFAQWRADLDSQVLDVGLTVIIWGALSHGWGEDITKFTLDDAKFAASLSIAIGIVWNAAVTSVRTSILLFYIRIFPLPRFRQICWFVIGLNLASLVAVILATALICKPIAFTYNRTIPGGHCGDLISFERFTAVWNLLCDATLVVLPMPILWNLHMQTRKKIGLSIIFSTGAIICVLTVTRVFVSAYYDVNNNTKQGAVVVLITGLEPTLGVINACLPFLPAVLHRISGSRFFLSVTQRFRSAKMTSSPKMNKNFGYGVATIGGSGGRRQKPKSDIRSSGPQMLPRVIGGRGRENSFKRLPDSDTNMELNLQQQQQQQQQQQGNPDRNLQRQYSISGGSMGSTTEEGHDEELSTRTPKAWDKEITGGDDVRGIHVRRDFMVDNDERV